MGGQYAAQECVTIIGTKLRAIENVRVLGPVRKQTQVEKDFHVKVFIHASMIHTFA